MRNLSDQIFQAFVWWALSLPQTSRANPVQCCSTHQKKDLIRQMPHAYVCLAFFLFQRYFTVYIYTLNCEDTLNWETPFYTWDILHIYFMHISMCLTFKGVLLYMYCIYICVTHILHIYFLHICTFVPYIYVCHLKRCFMVYILYGVALVSRINSITGLFCKIALWKRRYSAKETYNLIDPTDRSHPIYICISRILHAYFLHINMFFSNMYVSHI